MSEKLYRLTKAVDTFDGKSSIPKRCLVFEGPDGPHKVFFPKNRTTLFFKDELYDWYGHKVTLSNNIKKVLQPFGYFGNSFDSPKEQFLVVITGNRLALATLCHHERATYLSNTLEDFKHGLLHHDYASTQILEPLDWYFRKLTDLSSTCFGEHFLCANEYAIFAGVDDCSASPKSHPSFEEYIRPVSSAFRPPSIWFSRGHTYDNLLEHRVVRNRQVALGHFKEAEHTYANYLIGNLVVSNHGEKITATFPIPDKNGNNRISTDSETIKTHCDTDCLYWYYDPLP